MDTLAILILISMIALPIIFVIVLIYALRNYYGVNKNVKKTLQHHEKGKNPEALSFRLKSRGWIFYIFSLPIKLSPGGSQLVANIKLGKDSFYTDFFLPKNVPYTDLKSVDVFNTGISRNLIFNYKRKFFGLGGNIVDKEVLLAALKFLDSKGVVLSKRARKMLKSN
ncbi:MAG: hypothetical protein ACP5D2_03580 [Candidatus Nanoarchaeia archaeon]